MDAEQLEARMTAQRSIWGSIFDWIKQDESLNTWLTPNEQNVFMNNDPNMLVLWNQATLYQGFDIKRILRIMKVAYETYSTDTDEQNVEVVFTINGVQQTFRYSNKESMARDVSFLCFLFSTRGSTWEKFQAKSIEQLSIITDWLKAKYQIDDSVNDANSSLDPDTVTIPRIAACFPVKMCEYMALGYGKQMCTLAQMGLGEIDQISQAVLSPFFNCTLPHAWCVQGHAPHIFFFLLHVYVDNTIHKKERDYTDLDTMLTYYSAAFRTPGVPQLTRARYAVSSGLSNATGNGFKAAIIDAIPHANTLLRALRPTDPQLEVVIASLVDMTD